MEVSYTPHYYGATVSKSFTTVQDDI